MAKFSGLLGFELPQVEDPPGVWIPSGVVEKHGRGDMLSSSKTFVSGEKVNDDVDVSNRISIVADEYLTDNVQYLRYVVLHGTRWKVTQFEVLRPRITLTLGGVWNGEIPSEEA